MSDKEFNTGANYIRTRRKFFMLYIISVLLIFIPVYITFTDKGPLLYGTFMSSIFIIIFACYDFLRYKKDCEILRKSFFVDVDYISEIKDTKADARLYIFYMENIIRYYDDILEKKNTDFLEMKNFYTIWTHQIKTPISVLRLMEQELPENLSSQLKEELFRIETYVDLLLNYMRLNSKSSDYLFKQYSLDLLIKTCIRKYSHIFIKKKLSFDYTPLDIDIISDEKWFCFMFEQLLSNALKYTNEGGISISVKNITNNDTHKGRYAILLKDSGIGIAPEDLPRIQEFGYTGANGRIYAKSTGIGLYLCKRISQDLSMDLEIKSKLNKGTTVSLYIGDRIIC